MLANIGASVFRGVVLAVLVSFFEIFYFADCSRMILHTACISLALLVLLTHIVIQRLYKISERVVELSDIEEDEEIRPDTISPDIWALKSQIESSGTNIDAVVSELLSLGVDEIGLLELIDYVKAKPSSSRNSTRSIKSQNFIQIFGKVYKTWLSKDNLVISFPLTEFVSKIYIAASPFLCYIASYLMLSLRDQLLKRERGWLAVVGGICIQSILFPPQVEPYQSQPNDIWHGASRPVAISFIAISWRVMLCQPLSALAHYLIPVCRYMLLLFPVWHLIGTFGHPFAQMMAFLEGVNRYLFGQNAVYSATHWLRQTIRGTASVCIIWAVLSNHIGGEYSMNVAMGLATLINTLPVTFSKDARDFWKQQIIPPFAYSVISFALAFCGNVPAMGSYIFLGWLVLSEIAVPYLSTGNVCFILHMRLPRERVSDDSIRWVSAVVIAPILIQSIVREMTISTVVTSFVITHAIYKAHTEAHWLTLALVITHVTIPFELGISGKSDLCFLLSLLFIAKIEVMLPILDAITLPWKVGRALHLPWPIWNILRLVPLPDLAWRIPTALWCALTGAGLSNLMEGYVLVAGSPRPFRFWDRVSPSKKGIGDYHPICTMIKRYLANMIKYNFLGSVDAGDIFIVSIFPGEQNRYSFFLMHVMSLETNRVTVQVRGPIKKEIHTLRYIFDNQLRGDMFTRYKAALCNGVDSKITGLILDTHEIVSRYPIEIPFPMNRFLDHLLDELLCINNDILDDFAVDDGSAQTMLDSFSEEKRQRIVSEPQYRRNCLLCMCHIISSFLNSDDQLMRLYELCNGNIARLHLGNNKTLNELVIQSIRTAICRTLQLPPGANLLAPHSSEFSKHDDFYAMNVPSGSEGVILRFKKTRYSVCIAKVRREYIKSMWQREISRAFWTPTEHQSDELHEGSSGILESFAYPIVRSCNKDALNGLVPSSSLCDDMTGSDEEEDYTSDDNDITPVLPDVFADDGTSWLN